jgi:hypothetical protein
LRLGRDLSKSIRLRGHRPPPSSPIPGHYLRLVAHYRLPSPPPYHFGWRCPCDAASAAGRRPSPPSHRFGPAAPLGYRSGSLSDGCPSPTTLWAGGASTGCPHHSAAHKFHRAAPLAVGGEVVAEGDCKHGGRRRHP